MLRRAILYTFNFELGGFGLHSHQRKNICNTYINKTYYCISLKVNGFLFLPQSIFKTESKCQLNVIKFIVFYFNFIIAHWHIAIRGCCICDSSVTVTYMILEVLKHIALKYAMWRDRDCIKKASATRVNKHYYITKATCSMCLNKNLFIVLCLYVI